jgi:acetyltransferase-like isoleucine patch superfamily enzyme
MKKPRLDKARIRGLGIEMGARLLGRELAHLDYDQLVAREVLTSGRRSFGRPVVRGSKPRNGHAQVRIGNFCAIAEDAQFVLGGEHRTDWVTTFPLREHLLGKPLDGPFAKGDIIVRNDVWIGYSATILSGVTIGNGAVVGTSAVVAKDVRPYAIVVGNPAREVRRRFTDEQIDALENIAWWDWPDEKIASYAELLCSPNIDRFIDAAQTESGSATGT